MAISRETLFTLDLSADGGTDLIEVDQSTRIGIEVDGPAGTPTHVGTLYFRACLDTARTPKALDIPTVSFTAGNVVSELVEIVDFCFPYLQIYYDQSSDGTGETATFRVKVKK
jgi:hypothetical protein